jgi:hypothetical protein
METPVTGGGERDVSVVNPLVLNNGVDSYWFDFVRWYQVHKQNKCNAKTTPTRERRSLVAVTIRELAN